MLDGKSRMVICGEREYPLFCDFNVLEYIQREYGTIGRYQEIVTGNPGRDGNTSFTPINVRAVLDGITVMVNEGIYVQQLAGGEGLEEIDIKYAGVMLRSAGISLVGAAEIILKELTECISPKKEIPGQGGEKSGKGTQKSTLPGFSMWGKLSSITRKKK